MKTLWDTPEIPSCRRCGKRMDFDAGANDATGLLEVGWECVSCEWREEQRTWTHSYIRARIAAVNARYGGDGVEVPMVLSAEPFPVGEFDDE